MVSQYSLLALFPWRERSFFSGGVPTGSVPFYKETVTMDANLSGWGTVGQNRTAQGEWSTQNRAEHVNVLELRAVHLALKPLLPFLRGRCGSLASETSSQLVLEDQPIGSGHPGPHVAKRVFPLIQPTIHRLF